MDKAGNAAYKTSGAYNVDQTNPSTPTLTYSNITNSSVQLNWAAFSDSNSGYNYTKIHAQEWNGSEWVSTVDIDGNGTAEYSLNYTNQAMTSLNVTGLDIGTQYRFYIRYYDNAANQGNSGWITVTTTMPDVNESWANASTAQTGDYIYYTVPYTATYRITAEGGAYTASATGALVRGDFNLNAGDILIMVTGNASRASRGGSGGTYVAKVVTSSSYQMAAGTYNGSYVTPLVVAGGGQRTAGLATTSAECGGSGSGGGGGGGFATDGGNSSAYGGDSFLNGSRGGNDKDGGVNGSFGGGGGEDDDSSGDDGGGAGGWCGGNGYNNEIGYPGNSYNAGASQVNTTGGATTIYGKINIELIN